jgi:exonuclease SbcC
MEILSVTLKNFKTHSDRHFVFQPGTNAICGENGAGKTSILEAIAWTLFNYRGAYKIEDLIRNGASSAQATIAFISSRDGRTYEVQRCTSRGYIIYDPQLAQRLDYRHIEDEILPWLRQHLGVPPGTDLARLFANTLGVPQGMFTVDFLQSPESRKKVFDAILKVEEYKQANQEMLSLEKYAKAEEESLERAIAQYEETLQAWEPLQQRRQILAEEIIQNETVLASLQTHLSQLQAEKNQLSAQAQQVQHAESQLQQLAAQITGQLQTHRLLEQSVERANQAVQICEEHRSHYQAYLQTEDTLKVLGKQSKQHQTLLKQHDAKLKTLNERQLELTKLTVQLEALAKAQQDIQQLEPLVKQQTAWEQQQAEVANYLNQFQTLKLEQQTLSRQFTRLQKEQTVLTKTITQVRSLASVVAQIPDLEQQRDRIQEQLSRIEAAKQFESDLRQLVTAGDEQCDRHQLQVEAALNILRQIQQTVPLLAPASVDSALLALQSGVDLNTRLLASLKQILLDLSEQTSVAKLKQRQQEIKQQIDLAYRQQAEFATLDAKIAQQLQLQDEAEQLRERMQTLQTQLADEPQWQERRSQLIAELAQLGDPRGRSQFLANELQQQPQIQSAYDKLQSAQTTLQKERAELERQLAVFQELDAQIEQQHHQRQLYQPSYQTYLQYQKETETLPTLQTELQAAIAHLQQLQTAQTTLQSQYEQLAQNYDPQRVQAVESRYHETRSQADQIAGSLPQQHKLLSELDQQLTVLQETAEKRDRARADLKQKEKVRKFITFARKAYKEAGPRITERYVQNISREADKLFRELMNRPNVALEWTKDYEIIVRESAHLRRFVNLSGGEQMCAALAVRLALLRVLADIDIAFFDEPTTNMDRPRRESLAEAIANIKTFRQLFVISHDDTFEKVTENVIVVQRDAS